MHLTLILIAILPALVIIAGLKDLTSMTIPNWISGLLIVGYFPTAWAVGLSLSTVGVAVGLAVVALVLGAAMFAARWIGGGDAKLMAAAALWLGLSGIAPFLVWTGIAGGAFCLALMVGRRHTQPYLAGSPGWFARLMQPKGDIPYGVAIAAGALMAYPASPLMTAFSTL